MRTVGVLGGMGPAATLDFLAKVLAADPARVEQHKIRLIIDCNPQVLERNSGARGEGPSPGGDLAAMARGLALAGADFLVIACNTAHAWADEVAQAAGKPLLSMIEAACDALAERCPQARRIGVLAGQGCLDAELYQSAFARRGWEAVLPGPSDQGAFMTTLYEVKAGDLGEAQRAVFLRCARAVIDGGAQAVIAGCTEVPLLLVAEDLPVPLIDPTQASQSVPSPMRAATKGSRPGWPDRGTSWAAIATPWARWPSEPMGRAGPVSPGRVERPTPRSLPRIDLAAGPGSGTSAPLFAGRRR